MTAVPTHRDQKPFEAGLQKFIYTIHYKAFIPYRNFLLVQVV